MIFEVAALDVFRRQLQRLAKRHRSLRTDITELLESLKRNPEQGVVIQPGVRKVRLAIKSKGRGKSGGARVLTYLHTYEEPRTGEGVLLLVAIYDKSDLGTLPDELLTVYVELAKQNALNRNSDDR